MILPNIGIIWQSETKLKQTTTFCKDAHTFSS